MRSERRGGTSRQAPIAPPLGGGRFMFILFAIGLASIILIGRITLLQVIDRPFLQSQGMHVPFAMKQSRLTAA